MVVVVVVVSNLGGCVYFLFDEGNIMLKLFVLLTFHCCGEVPSYLEKGPRFGCRSSKETHP